MFLIGATYSFGVAAANFSCHSIFKNPYIALPVTNLNELSQAVSHGMIFRQNQAIFFDLYLRSHFHSWGRSTDQLFEIQKKFPTLRKQQFREYEISETVSVHPTSMELLSFKDQILSLAKKSFFQVLFPEKNIDFWTQALGLSQASVEKNKRSISSLFKKAHEFAKSEWDPSRKINSDQNVLGLLKLKYLLDYVQINGVDPKIIQKSIIDLILSINLFNSKLLALNENSDANEILYELKNSGNNNFLSYAFAHIAFGDLMFKFGIGIEIGTLTEILDIPKSLQVLLPAKRIVTMTRIRQLTQQEAPFRGCIGQDCSTTTYFAKAFDPNYIYFTATGEDGSSSGQVTLVLGEALNIKNGKFEKVAFVDKIQNFAEQRLPLVMDAIQRSVGEQGYKLGLSQETGHGLTGHLPVESFVRKLLPTLSEKYTQFKPHQHDYQFPIGASRA